jgi:alpha-tubulin suppressor-like RCC1 family protein
MMHAGYYHNLAVGASTGKLYSWGCGTFTESDSLDGVIPALGPHAKTDRGEAPTVVSFSQSNDDDDDVIGPNEKIRGISGGAYHSIVWMQPSGRIYTFGAGQLGQLGRRLGATVDESKLPVDPYPRPVEGLPTNDPIKSIAAGFYNTLAVCKSGKLYCAGENQNQQCGYGPRNLHTMTRVNEVSNVDSASGGYCHTLIKDLYGKVYSMGCGEDGQRGDGRSTDDENDDGIVHRSVATSVSLPVKARQVEAGANHSIVLGEDGVAYAFGANDVGQCGLDTDGEPITIPRPVKTTERIAQVSAGYAHTALTTESGRILMFGQNDNGQLGLANVEARTIPVESTVGKQ